MVATVVEIAAVDLVVVVPQEDAVHPAAPTMEIDPTTMGPDAHTVPRCQVCFKPNHTAVECWHRFDEDYVPDERYVAAAAASSYNVDTNWYTDTGSTDHITSELEKLSMREKYNGSDQIHVANGSDFEEGSPSRKV